MTGVSKTWVMTLNNYTEADEKMLKDFDKRRMAMGREICPTTGTPHLQVFITFKRAYRLKALKKLHPRAHWEIAKSNDWNYSLKDKNYEIQDFAKQGQRTDLENAKKIITETNSMREVVTEVLL